MVCSTTAMRFVCILCLYPLAALPQGAFEEWVARYDAQGLDDHARAVAVDAAGNVHVTGWTRRGATSDITTVKYDAAGRPLWLAFYDGPANGDDLAQAIALDPAGNVYVAGTSQGGATGKDIVLIKYDPAGNESWVARYNGPRNGDDQGNAISIGFTGVIAVVGSTAGTGTTVDYATVAYDAAGRQRWAAVFNGPGNGEDIAHAAIVDAGGGVNVTGQSAGTGTGLDYATVYYDAAGRELWVARYDGPANGEDVATGMAMNALGDICVTGRSLGATGYDIATILYNGAGAVRWTARYDGPAHDDDHGRAIAVDQGANVYVTGSSAGIATGFDYVTLKYDVLGTPLWSNRYDGPAHNYDIARAIAVDAGGNAYVTGESVDRATDFATVAYGPTGTMSWIARYTRIALGGDGAYAIALAAPDAVVVTGQSSGGVTDYDYATVLYRMGIPAPSGVTCAVEDLSVILTWTNEYDYDQVELRRDGEVIERFFDGRTRHTDPVGHLGSYAYTLTGILGGFTATSAPCVAAVTTLPPPRRLSCTVAAMEVRLTWQNAVAYEAIQVSRDGVVAAQLPAGQTTFTDTVAAPGEFRYEVAGVFESVTSESAACAIAVPLPAPRPLACQPVFFEVHLSWTNAYGYESIEVRRAGELVDTIAGNATEFMDVVGGLGFYPYLVTGVWGEFRASTPCQVEVTEVPPPRELACEARALTVTLAWKNAAGYDTILILRDGLEAARLPGETERYEEAVPSPREVTYKVIGILTAVSSPAVLCTVTARLPPPVEVTCSARYLAVDLAWTNGFAYGAIEIRRDGAPLTSLPGTATTYTDSVARPGSYEYVVVGAYSAWNEASEPCVVAVTEIPPPEAVRCQLSGDHVAVSWSNPIAYERLTLERNGAALAALEAGATSYVDRELIPGDIVYAVRGVLADVVSEASPCSVFVPLAPPRDLACAGGPFEARLSWTEAMAYDRVLVFRGGAQVGEVAGATSFSESFASCGEHAYELRAVAGGLESAPASCTAAVTEHPFFRGEVNGDGEIDIADAIMLLSYLFAKGRPPACAAAADMNADNGHDIGDPIRLLGYLFASQDLMPPQPRECGLETPACGGLGCKSFPQCD